MVNVDTNILVRAVLDDDPTESKIAKQLLQKLAREKKLFISSKAILEMAWVLKVKKYTRDEIHKAVLALVDAADVVIGHRETVTLALDLYRKGKGDFGDYLILVEGQQNGAASMMSFDKTLCKDNAHVRNPKK